MARGLVPFPMVRAAQELGPRFGGIRGVSPKGPTPKLKSLKARFPLMFFKARVGCPPVGGPPESSWDRINQHPFPAPGTFHTHLSTFPPAPSTVTTWVGVRGQRLPQCLGQKGGAQDTSWLAAGRNATQGTPFPTPPGDNDHGLAETVAPAREEVACTCRNWGKYKRSFK